MRRALRLIATTGQKSGQPATFSDDDAKRVAGKRTQNAADQPALTVNAAGHVVRPESGTAGRLRKGGDSNPPADLQSVH